MHGLMCTVMVTLPAAERLFSGVHVFCKLFRYFWCTSICADSPKFYSQPTAYIRRLNFCLISQIDDSPKFYSQPATYIRRPKFLLDLPSWWVAKAIFCWFAKVLRSQHFRLYGISLTFQSQCNITLFYAQAFPFDLRCESVTYYSCNPVWIWYVCYYTSSMLWSQGQALTKISYEYKFLLSFNLDIALTTGWYQIYHTTISDVWLH